MIENSHQRYLETLESLKGTRVDIDVQTFNKYSTTTPYTFKNVLITELDDKNNGMWISISNDRKLKFIYFYYICQVRICETILKSPKDI